MQSIDCGLRGYQFNSDYRTRPRESANCYWQFIRRSPSAMLFNKNNGTLLTTVWGDVPFVNKLATLLNIPPIYEDAWSIHHMSFEIIYPVNQYDRFNIRIYTKQTMNERLPLVRGVGDYVTSKHEQTITPAYVIECDAANFYTLERLLETQLQHPKSTLSPELLKNLNNIQQQTLLNQSKVEVKFTQLITHENKLESQLGAKHKNAVVETTGQILNTKFPPAGRTIIEKELITYDKSNYIYPKHTVDFYTGTKVGLQVTLSEPKVAPRLKAEYIQLDMRCEQVSLLLRKTFKF